MPFLKVYVHLIWATKRRSPIISKDLKPLLLKHIRENGIKKGIFIDQLNCVEDHIHLLISMNADQTIANIVRLLKGESSHWVNKEKLLMIYFEWQDDYIALSVSNSALRIVRAYIRNQEAHHKAKNYIKEHSDFLKVEGEDQA